MSLATTIVSKKGIFNSFARLQTLGIELGKKERQKELLTDSQTDAARNGPTTNDGSSST